jgi:hypothetical protein
MFSHYLFFADRVFLICIAFANDMNIFADKGGWNVNPGNGAFYGPKIGLYG